MQILSHLRKMCGKKAPHILQSPVQIQTIAFHIHPLLQLPSLSSLTIRFVGIRPHYGTSNRGYVSQSTAMHLIFFVFVTFWRPELTALHLPRPQGPPLLFTPGPVNIWYFEKRSQNIDPPPFKPPPSLLAFSLSLVGRLILVTCPPPFAPLWPYLNHCWYLDSELLSYVPGL